MSSYNKETTTTTGTGTIPTMGHGQTHTVQSVTRDAQAQIDAQVAQALEKSRALNEQDHARLQSSIGTATSSLQQQAEQLKRQIDEEARRAEQEVIRTQREKVSSTDTRQAMEEKAILEAAAQRKMELEQKAIKLQQEIDEITRRKTAEMMDEKPGNLQFQHQHADTNVTAQLAGNIGHALDITKGGQVTTTTAQGDVQYHPVKVQEIGSGGRQEATAHAQSMETEKTHEKQGGIMHALKTMITGEETPATTQTTQQQAVKTTQPAGTGAKTYDQETQWAAQADKLAGPK